MPEDSAAARPVQIPARIQAVGPGWRQLLEQLHEQIRTVLPGYHLLDLKEGTAACASTWSGRRAAATPCGR
jgi:hypothetical protein